MIFIINKVQKTFVMAKGTKNLINEMKTMLASDGRRRLTVEGLVYGEDGEEMMGAGNMDMDGAGPEAQAEGAQDGGMPAQGMAQGKTEVNPLDEDPKITQLITNIRVQTLEGLRALAENPESAQYELLKKIFLMIDKAVEEKANPED